MTIYKCSVCEYSYTQSFFRSHDRKLEYRGPCRLCEIEERLAALQNLAENHAEDGSRSSRDVEIDSTLASTVAMLESRLSALDERMDAVEPCRCRCKGDDSLSTEGILGDLSGTPEEDDVTDDGVVVADQLRADISSLACADVNTSSIDDAPGAAVASAVAELVANIREMAETEARAVESSLCEAPATANPPEAAPKQKARNPKRRRRNRRRSRRQQQAGGDGEATALPSHGSRLDAPLVDERSDVRVTSCGLPVCDIGGEQKTVLLGDSIVREQEVEFAQRCASKRRVVCGPGKGVDWLAQEVHNLSLGSREDVVVTHVGTNDLRRMRQDELTQRYESVVRSLREKTDKVLVTSVLPRPRDGAAGVELVRTINRSLQTMCDRAGAQYVDLYPHFDGVRGIFRDGLHLNGWGAARFGRLLNQAVVKLCSPGPDVRLNSQRDQSLQNG